MAHLYYCGNQWGYTPLGVTTNIPTGFCNPPTGLTTTVLGQYVTFSWIAPHDYLRFDLEYRVAGPGAYTVVQVTGTSIQLPLVASTTYEWRVKTVCQVGINESAYTNGSDVTTGIAFASCAAVSAVTVTHMGTYYQLDWVSTGAQYYKIEVWRDDAPNVIAVFNTQAITFNLNNLGHNQFYNVRVTAICQDPNLITVPSPIVLFQTGNLSCSQPTSLVYTASSTSVIISWMGQVGNTYNIYLNGQPVAFNYPNTTFTFTGLLPGTTYTIDVRANCINGFSIATSVTLVTRPAVCPDPTAVSVGTFTPTGFIVNWTPAGGIVSQQVILNNGDPIPLGAGVNNHVFTNLPSGSNNIVTVRSVCAASASTGVQVVANLTGCAAPTGLASTPGSTSALISWNPVANAAFYHIIVRKNSDASIVFEQDLTTNSINVFPLLPATLYDIEVTAHCGPPGTTLTISTALTGQVTTSATPSCEAGVLGTTTPGQNGVDFVYTFASGRTTGNIKVVVKKDSDNSIVYSQTFSSIQPISVTGLLAATQYDIYIYNEVIVNGITCAEVQVGTFTTTAICQPPSNIVLTLQNNETEINVAATASPSAPPTYQVQHRIDDGSWIDDGAQTLPYVITGIIPGRYQVRLRSNCVASVSAWVESNYICTTPTITTVAVSQNKVTVYWGIMQGVTQYTVELRSLAGGTSLWTTSGQSIEIPGLDWNTNFIVKVSVECSVGVFVNSANSSFATGSQTTAVDPSLCPAPSFTAYIQDCSVTDPTGEEHGPDDDGGTPAATGCVLEKRDWEIFSFMFADINVPPNNGFMELTLVHAHAIPDGVTALLPGGILGNVSAACRPLSTLTLPFVILQGGAYISGSVTVQTNGDVTISGSYTSDGLPHVIIRAAGNYVK